MRPLSIARRVFLSIILCCASVAPALADGKIFPPVATSSTPVIIPDQQAMIVYQDGVETMVIRNHFSGQGREFAWGVPVPSLPTVTETSRGLFPTLETLCTPRVIHNVPRLVIWLLAVFLIGVAFMYGKGTQALFAAAIVLLVFSILLTSLGNGATSSSVTVHSREQIGAHEVTTISSEDPDALVAWLKDRDFAVDARDEGLIADYAAAGWFLCAVKLARSADEDVSTAPPLAFSFKTDAPVYPLRLTGTHDNNCNVDLYIFGPGRAELSTPGFETILCKRTSRGQTGVALPRNEGNHVPIVHPRLKELVHEDLVLTRLAGSLAPSSMSQDVLIGWEPFRAEHKVVYSSQAVRRIMVNVGAAALCVTGLALVGAVRHRRISRARAFRLSVLSGLLVAAGGTLGYYTWPKVDVHLSRWPVLFNQNAHETIAANVSQDLGMEQQDMSAVARRGVGEFLQQEYPKSRNNFTGQPRIEEDSPGNYGIRQTEAGVEYLWYDQDGGEHAIRLVEAMNTWPDRPPSSLPETPAIEGN